MDVNEHSARLSEVAAPTSPFAGKDGHFRDHLSDIISGTIR